nr:AsnC family protein [Candidatus Njordarchaeum guaymaensis]
MDTYQEELMRRYRDLFVDCNDVEVQKLYWLLCLFFAKCDGLLSNAQVHQLMGNLPGTPFDPYLTPMERRDSILVRLKFLKKYNVNNPQEIMRVLTWGLFSTEKFDPSHRKYLVEFVENPDRPFTWIANKLGVSTSTVLEAFRRLADKIQFRFISALNYPLLKLKHFMIFFKPNDEFRSSMLSRPFTQTINRDTFGDWMWASFLVPDQNRILREFRDSLNELGEQVFNDHRFYEVKSIGRSCNLSMFDGEKWIYSEDVIGVGSLKFAERGKGVLPRLKEFEYGEKPIKFDKVDFLIACLKFGNARVKNSEIGSILHQYGYNLSWVTLSKRVTSLRRAGVFIPYFNFSGLGLNVASTFAVECDHELLETLYYAFPQFPECTASRTDKGVVFMVRTAAETAPAISYLVQSSLQNRADDLIVASRLENIGSRGPTSFANYWNSDKQYWEFEKGSFDLTKNINQDR